VCIFSYFSSLIFVNLCHSGIRLQMRSVEMYRNFHLAVLSGLCLIGCAKNPSSIESHYTQIEDSQLCREQLQISILPINDATDGQLPWNADADFQAAWRCRHGRFDHVHFTPQERVKAHLNRMGLTPQDAGRFFDPDLSFAAAFADSDFIVALELIENNVEPIIPQSVSWDFPADAVRVMSLMKIQVRLRVIDIRHEHPVILAQELFSTYIVLPEGGSAIDYERQKWGNKQFATTPFGKGQQRMLTDLCAYLETLLLRL
jgi:hypothetical protein